MLRNGKVLVAGGYATGPLATAELYDPATGAWSATGSLKTARFDHTATLLADGKVLVAAGYNGSIVVRSAELYDPVTGTWQTTGQLTRARENHTATLLSDGRVLVAGGNDTIGNGLDDAEIYDPASGTWSATDSLRTDP